MPRQQVNPITQNGIAVCVIRVLGTASICNPARRQRLARALERLTIATRRLTPLRNHGRLLHDGSSTQPQAILARPTDCHWERVWPSHPWCRNVSRCSTSVNGCPQRSLCQRPTAPAPAASRRCASAVNNTNTLCHCETQQGQCVLVMPLPGTNAVDQTNRRLEVGIATRDAARTKPGYMHSD